MVKEGGIKLSKVKRKDLFLSTKIYLNKNNIFLEVLLFKIFNFKRR